MEGERIEMSASERERLKVLHEVGQGKPGETAERPDDFRSSSGISGRTGKVSFLKKSRSAPSRRLGNPCSLSNVRSFCSQL